MVTLEGAAGELGIDIAHLLTGPTAIAFAASHEGAEPADPAAVAKALRDFARTHRSLVLKGGVLGDRVLTADDLVALADLPSRDVMLAVVLGTLGAPLSKFAGLLEALPRNFAFGLQALIDARTAADAGGADTPDS